MTQNEKKREINFNPNIHVSNFFANFSYFNLLTSLFNNEEYLF